MADPGSAPFRLGDLEVLPRSGEIVGPTGRKRVRPLLMQVLLRLVAAEGAPVSRERLLEEAWPRRMVNDEVLSRTIAELRDALGDDARTPRYVETLPKLGYRLIARVEPIDAAGADDRPVEQPTRPRAASLPMPRRVVVAGAVLAIAGVLAGAWRTFAPPAARPAHADLERRLLAARPFTAGPGVELAPRFAPDGRAVAFVEGDATGSVRLVITTVGSGERRVLEESKGVLHSPVWLREGSEIAFYRADAAGACAIVVRELAGTRERQLTGCKRKPLPRFDVTPDGRTLVVAAQVGPSQPMGVVAIDTASGAERVLSAPGPGDGDDVLPRVSPDGRRVAFFRGTESHRQLWLMPLDRPADARPASQLSGLAYGAAWLDDATLLVAADWLGFRALTRVDVATGHTTLAGARGARHPDVTRAGDIVYEQAQYHADVNRVGADGAAQPLWPSTRYSSQMEPSPDGLSVAFSSNRDGTDAVYVGRPGSDLTRLGPPPDARLLRPHWSADARAIYAVAETRTAMSETRRGVRIAVPSGTIEWLPLGDAVFDVRESADGSTLYVAEEAAHAARLWRAPRDHPETRERLPFPLVSEYRIVGQRLYFAQPQLRGLTACDLVTLVCGPLPVPVDDDNRFEWAASRAAIYYRAADERQERVERFDLATGVRAVRYVDTTSGVAAIGVTADDATLYVARAEPPAVDLFYAPARVP